MCECVVGESSLQHLFREAAVLSEGCRRVNGNFLFLGARQNQGGTGKLSCLENSECNIVEAYKEQKCARFATSVLQHVLGTKCFFLQSTK